MLALGAGGGWRPRGRGGTSDRQRVLVRDGAEAATYELDLCRRVLDYPLFLLRILGRPWRWKYLSTNPGHQGLPPIPSTLVSQVEKDDVCELLVCDQYLQRTTGDQVVHTPRASG